jgi:hypothetical protein
MTEDLSLPLREDGCIVQRVSTSYHGAGDYASYHVHYVPEEGTEDRRRYDNCDDLTHWCDEEFIKLPHSWFGGEPTTQELLETVQQLTFEEEVSVCKECQTKVQRGTLERDTGYVANVCSACNGSCTSCGESNWEHLGKKRDNSARSAPRWKCTDCGHIKKGITTG